MVDVQVVMQVKGHSFKIDIVESPVKRLKGDCYLHTQAGLEAAHRSLLAPQEEREMPDPARPERGPGCDSTDTDTPAGRICKWPRPSR